MVIQPARACRTYSTGLGRLIFAQQYLVLGIIDDEIYSGLNFTGAVEVAHGGLVVPAVHPFVLHAELEIRDGESAFDGLDDLK